MKSKMLKYSFRLVRFHQLQNFGYSNYKAKRMECLKCHSTTEVTLLCVGHEPGRAMSPPQQLI